MAEFKVLGWEAANTDEHRRLFLHVLNGLADTEGIYTIEITPPHYIDNPRIVDFQCYMTVRNQGDPEHLFGFWDGAMYGCENSEDSTLRLVY